MQLNALSALITKPEDTRFDGQESGEEIIFLLRRHWVTNVPWLFGCLVALFVPTFIFSFPEVFGFLEVPAKYQFAFSVVWCLCVLGFAFEKFLSWFFNAYLVTDRRVLDIDFWGIFFTHVSEAAIDKIQDVTYQMGGITQVLFNYGDVYIQTAGEKREFEFVAIPNPSMVHDKLTDLVAPVKGKKG